MVIRGNVTGLDMAHKATTLAKWFINRVDRDSGDDITHLKLQKLLYYAQAWHLAHTDEPLFNEDIKAWTHGPVVPSVWTEYKSCGWNPLDPVEPPKLDKETVGFLENVFAAYGGFTAKKLEQMTHAELPWREARGDLPLEAKCVTPISRETMGRYYASRLEKNGSG